MWEDHVKDVLKLQAEADDMAKSSNEEENGITYQHSMCFVASFAYTSMQPPDRTAWMLVILYLIDGFVLPQHCNDGSRSTDIL